MDDKIQCTHAAPSLRLLQCFITPHIRATAAMSVAQFAFHCIDCGDIILKHREIARGYMQDGSVPEEMIPVMEKQVQSDDFERRVQTEVSKRLSRVLPQGTPGTVLPFVPPKETH